MLCPRSFSTQVVLRTDHSKCRFNRQSLRVVSRAHVARCLARSFGTSQAVVYVLALKGFKEIAQIIYSIPNKPDVCIAGVSSRSIGSCITQLADCP